MKRIQSRGLAKSPPRPLIPKSCQMKLHKKICRSLPLDVTKCFPMSLKIPPTSPAPKFPKNWVYNSLAAEWAKTRAPTAAMLNAPTENFRPGPKPETRPIASLPTLLTFAPLTHPPCTGHSTFQRMPNSRCLKPVQSDSRLKLCSGKPRHPDTLFLLLAWHLCSLRPLGGLMKAIEGLGRINIFGMSASFALIRIHSPFLTAWFTTPYRFWDGLDHQTTSVSPSSLPLYRSRPPREGILLRLWHPKRQVRLALS